MEKQDKYVQKVYKIAQRSYESEFQFAIQLQFRNIMTDTIKFIEIIKKYISLSDYCLFLPEPEP